MTQLVLSLGSNIERDKHVRFAIRKLSELFGNLRISPVYETTAFGFDGPDFYNLVVIALTELELDDVLEKLREIETGAGRVRSKKCFQSRSLDIDVLLFGDADLRGRGYNIPRDEIEHAAYVLRPLADVLPQQRHPVTGERFEKMWQDRMQDQPLQTPVEINFAQTRVA